VKWTKSYTTEYSLPCCVFALLKVHLWVIQVKLQYACFSVMNELPELASAPANAKDLWPMMQWCRL